MPERVHDRFAAAVSRWPDRPFLRVLPETAQAYGIPAGAITYAEAGAEVDTIIETYRAAGYGAGHRVGVLLENRPAFVTHWLALNALGVSIVPINPALRREELGYLIAHSEMVLAIALEGRHRDLVEASAALPVVGPDAAPPAVVHEAPGPPAGVSGSDAAQCALLYTSGTTGRPKGCILTNDYFVHCGDWYAGVGGAIGLRVDPPERMLTPLPLFHVNALAFSVMGVMTVGGCLTVLDRFHPRTWWDSVRTARASIVHYLGIMPPLWMAEPEGPLDRDHEVRAGFGAGIDPALHVAAESRFGFPLVEGWAMTETGAGGVIMATEAPRKPGSSCFGRPRQGVEVRILDDSGAEVADGTPGELLVRRAGPDPRRHFFAGYLKDSEATGKAWSDGWLHTGDVVSRDAEGDLHFVDRKKNVIRRSGENISAVEVESVLARHPAIAAIAIAPVPDGLRGEEVMALIVSAGKPAGKPTGTPAGTPDPDEITRWCLARLAYFKAPGWIAFVESLPLTATEKLQRSAVRALARECHEAGEAHDTRALKRPT